MTLRLEKPKAVTDLPAVLPGVFEALKAEFDVRQINASLDRIDDVTGEQLADPREVAAFTMRKLQLLHHISQDGVYTTNDIIIGLTAEIARALKQLAPRCSRRVLPQIVAGQEAMMSAGTAAGTLLADYGEVAELY